MIPIFFSYLWNIVIYCFGFLFAQTDIIAATQQQRQLPVTKHVQHQQQELDENIIASYHPGCARHVESVRRKAKMDKWGSFMPKRVRYSIARTMGYSQYEVDFVNILKRFFNKKSNYKRWINNVGSQDGDIAYINKVLKEFYALPNQSERALIKLFHKHWNILLGLSVNANVKTLCEAANKRTSFNVYMKQMSRNFFIMYWVKDHLRMF